MAPATFTERRQIYLGIAIVLCFSTTLIYRSATPVSYSSDSHCDCRSSEDPECINVCKKITSVFLPKFYDRSTHEISSTGDTVAAASKTSAADSTKTSAAASTKTSAAASTKTSAADSTKTSPAYSTKTSAADSTKTSATASTLTSAADSTKTSAAATTNAAAAAAAAVSTTMRKHKTVPNFGECNACFAGKSLVTVNKGWICGQARIGNKMFMMAPAIATAVAFNRTFVLPQGDAKCDWIDMLKDFFISVNSTIPLLPEKSFKDWKIYGEGGFANFNPIEPDSNLNISIAGYRQSWKYFNTSSQASALRQMFRFNSKYDTAAVNSLQSAKSILKIQQPIFVGVHMRIGDLKEKSRLDYGYQMANQSFYLNALEAANTLFNQSKSIIFMVASDTLEEAKKILLPVEKSYNIVWLHGSAYEDFAALSYCNHSIISGGTYGFWTAWLAGGETFYFSNFSKPGTGFHKGFIASNFYLPQWRPVGWTKYIF